jgi:hypothetical protein
MAKCSEFHPLNEVTARLLLAHGDKNEENISESNRAIEDLLQSFGVKAVVHENMGRVLANPCFQPD